MEFCSFIVNFTYLTLDRKTDISSVLFIFKLLYFEKIIGENGRFTHVWFVRS